MRNVRSLGRVGRKGDFIMPTPPAAEVVLSGDDRIELEGWARRYSSAAGVAMRTRIVLAAAEGGVRPPPKATTAAR